jgi:SanA protein
MKRKRKYFLAILITGLTILTFTYFANKIIKTRTKEFLIKDLNEIKSFNAGLLLGTSKTLKSGKRNDYFFNRIKATVTLYKNEKIKYIIVSGDNSHENYNEPQDMKEELIKQGIPDSVVFLDYAGFRTFDSVIRAKEIFGQDSIIIISQQFHNERAIYIARKNNISAWGYNAKDINNYKGFKTKIREYFARDKVFIDLLLGTKPKFLGQKITLR